MSFLHISTQPWYGATLAVAMRLHQAESWSEVPYWRHAHNTAERLVATFPDATRDQIEATLLHGTLEDKRLTAATLHAERVRPAVIRIIQRITQPRHLTFLDWISAIVASGDVDAMRILLVDSEETANALGASRGRKPSPEIEGMRTRAETRHRTAISLLSTGLGLALRAIAADRWPNAERSSETPRA